METITPNKDLGTAFRAIELAMEELKDLNKQEEDVRTRRAQIKLHLGEIQKKTEEVVKLLN